MDFTILAVIANCKAPQHFDGKESSWNQTPKTRLCGQFEARGAKSCLGRLIDMKFKSRPRAQRETVVSEANDQFQIV
jgi:hypothetical protein